MNFDFTKEPGLKLVNNYLETDVVPLVSIITPWYNAEKNFIQTFQCVINQTFLWFEWIIVDDGSTSVNGLKLLEELKKKDRRIKVIHKDNGGIASARNLGISIAATEYIVPLDGDDLISPNYLEMNYWALKLNPDASWSYTNCVGFQGQEYLWKKTFSSEVMKTDNLLTCTAMIRKNDLLSIGCYEEVEKHYNEDWLAWLKLLAKEKRSVHINEYGFWYRRSNAGVLSLVNDNTELQERAKKVILQAAKQVKKEIKAIEYPFSDNANSFTAPRICQWPEGFCNDSGKKNILFIIPWLEMGGADLFNLQLVKKINRSKYKVSILTTERSNNTWQQLFEEYVSDIFNLPNFLKMEDYPEFIHYFVKAHSVDIVLLSNSYLGYHLVPWLREQFPHIAVVDYVHMEEWYWRNGGYARLSGVSGNLLDKTYVCNERTRQVLINSFNRKPESVKTIYIGVDQNQFKAEESSKGNIRKQYSISNHSHIILFPCRLHPQKRPFLMLEIAKRLQKDEHDYTFIIVGDGCQLSDMEAYVNKNNLQNTVIFAGRQQDMRPFYEDASLTLICSLKEGLALTAYESLAMGTPVITSDVGGQAELINETVGRVIPLHQQEDSDLDNRDFNDTEILLYENAIIELLSDKKKYSQLCKNARARIEEGFSTDIMVNNMEQEFELLLEDQHLIQVRNEISKKLKCIPTLPMDYYTIYQEYEKAKLEQEEVWSAREWFRTLYEQEKEKNLELEQIKSMRSWKLTQYYVSFMENTSIGKCVVRVRNLLVKR